MGGNKSKPVVESARAVLAKRGIDVDGKIATPVVAAISENLSPAVPPVFNYGTIKNPDMNPNILDRISRWDVVHTKEKTPTTEVSSTFDHLY